MENTNPNTPPTLVQHVAKSSSDQLLRKFAEVSPDDKKDLRLAKRLKASQATHKKMMMMMMMKKNESESESGCGRDCNKSSRRRRPTTGLSEGKSLLLPCSCTCNNKRAKTSWRLGGDIKNRYIISAIKKTWRRTVEGGSRVLMEKHYNRHKRLINDSSSSSSS